MRPNSIIRKRYVRETIKFAQLVRFNKMFGYTDMANAFRAEVRAAQHRIMDKRK